MNNAFGSIKAGLDERIAHPGGQPVDERIHHTPTIDVKAIRSRVGMFQTKFASSFGISVATLRHWERGDRQPHGPACMLLKVVAKRPEMGLSA